MLTVHRYVINESVNNVQMPVGAEILSVGLGYNEDTKKEEISVWAKVDTSDIKQKRTFLVFGTGANMSETVNFKLKFLGTVSKANKWAFHIFELLNN